VSSFLPRAFPRLAAVSGGSSPLSLHVALPIYGTAGRLKWGGDAALRGDSRSLPRKVKLVDLFSGPVALDESGQADIPLDLPDFRSEETRLNSSHVKISYAVFCLK